MSEFEFEKQQAEIDRIKSKTAERIKDSEIQDVIDELRLKGRQDGKLAFRPLVAMECDDGPIEREVVIEAVEQSDLENKGRLIKALKKKEITATVEDGVLRLQRAQ